MGDIFMEFRKQERECAELKKERRTLKTQLTDKIALLKECREVVRMVTNTLLDMESIHPDGLPAKYLSAYEGMLLVGPEAADLLPRLEAATEGT